MVRTIAIASFIKEDNFLGHFSSGRKVKIFRKETASVLFIVPVQSSMDCVSLTVELLK